VKLERVLMQENAKKNLHKNVEFKCKIYDRTFSQLILYLDGDKAHLAKNYRLPEYD